MATVTNDPRDPPGWYGKLSSLGDFASRRLPPDCVQACDAWLSQAMQGSREQLGPRWLEVYLTAPLLRFAWAPGVIDRQWWFGLLMPSCDSVGRYFPLLIAHPRGRPPEDRIALDHLELWYEHLSRAAMRTLHDEQASVEALEGALLETPPWPTPGHGPALASTPGVQGMHERMGRAATLSQWLHALAVRELQSQLEGCTLWWRVTETGVGDVVDIVRGLPGEQAFVELLAGPPSQGG